jgi:hypothetical protein
MIVFFSVRLNGEKAGVFIPLFEDLELIIFVVQSNFSKIIRAVCEWALL